MAKDKEKKVDAHTLVTDKIIEHLEAGHVPWQKPWATVGGIHTPPCNLQSEKQYKGINTFLLNMDTIMNGYETPIYCTMNQANKMGGKVNKGEKSSLVVFWKMIETPKVDESTGEKIINEETEEAETNVRPFLRYYRVFNIDQTEGITKAQKIKDDLKASIEEQIGDQQFNPIDYCDQIIDDWRNASNGCPINYGGDRASYSPMFDSITIPRKEAFLAANIGEAEANYYHTTFHEMGHATGSSGRLGRKELVTDASDRKAYAREELTAEMTASFLDNHCGIMNDVTFTNTAAYIQAWLQCLNDDKYLVRTAATRAEKAFDYIIEAPKLELSEEVSEDVEESVGLKA